MQQRHITGEVLAALRDTPVVLLHGARQSGKTTLVRSIAENEHVARYLTLDDMTIFAAAQADPQGFVSGLEGPVVIDEIQRVPELSIAIKLAVDRDRRPGRFLLTGSSNVMQVPRLSESLAGRMEILALRPFSQGEIGGVRERFVDSLFASKPPRTSARGTSPSPGEGIEQRILFGGYPEALQRRSTERRRAWFGSYLDAILQRDVRDLANIENLALMPRLLTLVAGRVGSLLNVSDVSRSLQAPQSTVKRYLAILEATFLLQLLPSWSSNLGLRVAKSPKVYLGDTGLLAHLLGVDQDGLVSDPGRFGHILENFVVLEILKQCSWSRTRPRVHHFRSRSGHEVDVVLEDERGRLVAVEVKGASTLSPKDFRGIRRFAEDVGGRLHRGIVLYRGDEIVSFGQSEHAVPLSMLWN